MARGVAGGIVGYFSAGLGAASDGHSPDLLKPVPQKIATFVAMFVVMFSWGVFVLSALMLVPLTVLLAQVVAACLPQSRKTSMKGTGRADGQQALHRPGIAVLVPAHNEASGI
ncbi:MAG: hypothetical protein EBT08_21235, partial [Betaproteobacteria bacterium]|nr:hypothetical protein [Betaproteobacteria bacterium]